MERLLRQAEEAASKVATATTLLSLNEDESLESTQGTLEACLLAYDKAAHALQSEREIEERPQFKGGGVADSDQYAHIELTARTNIGRAVQVLTTIVEDYSLDKATADAFSAIKGKVSNVFAQIHSPPEYELGNLDEGQLIIRRDTKEPHAVNQVSSGQRAGLALSIFLALNDSAKTAPPIVLIDDPVAHIDDMNALSFLDYLREMAVSGRKQIFFATADVRLAALFQRKFEFLGNKQFKRIALTQ